MAIRRSLRSALSVLMLASMLGLSACGGGAGAEAKGSPGTSVSAAPSSPTPSIDPRPTPASSTGPARNLPKPELPAAAKENTKAGFEAFTQYWFDTVTYALETGDTGPLKEASSDQCKMCASYAESASTANASGGWRVGPKWRIDDLVSDMKLDPLGQVVGYFSMTESASQVIAADQSITKSRSGRKLAGAQAIYGKFENGKWRTTEAGQA